VDLLAPLKTDKQDAAFRLWVEQTAPFLAAHPTGWNPLQPAEITAANFAKIFKL